MREITHCIGATLKEPLRYQVKPSKLHGSGSGFINVIIKTANATMRMHNLTQADKEYAQQHLDPNLMKLFQYKGPMVEISDN